MLLLNTVKLVLIAMNILPYRITHRKVLFMIYLGTLVTHVMMDEPRFAQPIPNVTVAVGRDANLPCVVEHLGTYKVAWIHIDRQMILTIHRHVISRIPRYSITYDNANTWLLHVSQAQQDDRGYYMCQVNTNPMISQVGYLQVVVPPNILDIESTPSSVAVRENQNINMTCRADGFPAPKIIWRREDGESITVERKKKGKNSPMVYDGEVLPLSKVSRNEMGAYLCIATNGVPPSVSKRIILDVEFSPMIWVPNQLVGAPTGTDVTIDCNTEAHPKAIIYWIYNSTMLLPSKKYKIDYTENSYRAHMKLTIKNLQHDNFGNYRCISKNSLGETEGSIRVYDIPLPSSPSKQITHVFPEPKENSVLRNDSTRIVQPEVVFPMRSESHGSPNGPIERKGTVAIGQSVFYTDFPPKKYGHSGSNSIKVVHHLQRCWHLLCLLLVCKMCC
ncbi:lachesin [Bradysia coprophila]|uniref:lachesin n=1 Tax=Bradysia coprophila TaxID=38358 RepID=UPI00187D8AFC|nr:lachesin [Bradysia coprophila]XP_037039662.1 lachesin [Bradysia coprophila]XP_037039677.1 lachesin [Bradysia coprophila]